MLDHIYQMARNKTNPQDQNKTSPLQFKNISSTKVIPKIVAQTLRVKDPLIHVTLYEWLLAHDMLSELLDVEEPTLGEFLRRNATRNGENVVVIDLLWKYYEKNNHHPQAAQILDNLAMTRSENISLEQRIEYLVRAVMCMRNGNVGSSITSGIFLKELEDKVS